MEIIFNVVIGKCKRFIWRVLVLIWYNTNLVSKYAINKLEYIFLLEGKNYLHSRSYGNNI